MNSDGQVTQRVRNIEKFTIDITSVDNWFVAPDSALDTLTQLLLANRQNVQALKDIDRIEYYCDIMLYGDFEEKKRLVETEEVKKIERKYSTKQ